MRVTGRSPRVGLAVQPGWRVVLVLGTLALGLVVVWPWLRDGLAAPIAVVCLATAYVAAGVLSAGFTNARLLVGIGLVSLANEVGAWGG